MKLVVGLFSLLFIFSSDAQDVAPKKKYNIKVVTELSQKLSSLEKRNLKKNSYEILMRTSRFNFVIDQGAKLGSGIEGLLELRVKVGIADEKGTLLRAHLTLNAINEAVRINEIKDSRIVRSKLQLRIKQLVYKLFYGSNFNEKKGVVSKDVMVIEDRDLIVAPPEVNPSKDEEKETQEEKPIDPVTETEDDKKEDKKVIVEKSTKKQKKKKDPAEISNFDSPDINIKKELPEPRKPVEVDSKWNTGLRYFVGQEAETIVTDSIAEVKTTTERLKLSLSGSSGVEGTTSFIYYNASLGMISGEHEFGFGPKYSLLGGYFYDPFDQIIALGLVGGLDSFNFASIVERGSGVSKFSHNAMWIGAGAKIYIETPLIDVFLEGAYLISAVGTTTFNEADTISTTGTKMVLSAGAKIWRGFGLALQSESVSISGESANEFTVTDNSISLNLTYN